MSDSNRRFLSTHHCMHYNKPAQKSSMRIPILVLVLILGALLLHLYFAHSITPAESLAKAVTVIESSDLLSDDVPLLLQTAEQNALLAHWAKFYTGKYYEKLGKFEEALLAYNSVAEDSAAGIRAGVAAVRVGDLLAPDSNAKRRLGKFENIARLLGWHDIIAEIQLLRAEELLRAGDSAEALSIASQIRRSNAPREYNERAFEMTNAILETISPVTPSILLEQITLAIQHKKAAHAETLLTQLKQQLPENSPAHIEALLIEEEVLRALNRGTEADHVLLTVAAHGDYKTADVALFKIARNYWNLNDHQRALEMVGKLFDRFPKSDKLDEARYMEARILEEINEKKEAYALYQSLGSKSADPYLRFVALKRLAWIHYLEGAHRKAELFFQKAGRVARNAFQIGSPGQLNFSDFLHTAYWEGVTLELQNSPDEARKRFERVYAQDPNGYYRYLAAEKLGASILPARPAQQDPRCAPLISPQNSELLATLRAVNLYTLIQSEIDWLTHHLEQGDADAFLSRALLLGMYGNAKAGIASAAQTFQMHAFATQPIPCLQELFKQSFPTLYEEIVTHEAAQQGLDPAFVYAIARTESSFDPDATSGKDARGLMQLLVRTATGEGLTKNESLYDPAVNIRLGTKHLQSLSKQYKNNAQIAAAYNAGGAATNRWIDRYAELSPTEWIEFIGYPETQRYVKHVLRATAVYQAFAKTNLDNNANE